MKLVLNTQENRGGGGKLLFFNDLRQKELGVISSVEQGTTIESSTAFGDGILFDIDAVSIVLLIRLKLPQAARL